MFATDGTWREAGNGEWRRDVAPALVASIVLLLAVATFLLTRRVSGRLDSPLAPLPLIATAVALLAWACLICLRLRDRRADWAAAAVLALFAVACSFPGHRVVDWLAWSTALGVYGLLVAKHRPRPGGRSRAPDQLLQRLTRTRTADGIETIRGTLVANFAPGERITVLHVAFCPPWERLPSVEAEAVDGPACDVKLAQILHQGARLEARLSRASTVPQHVTIKILATQRPPLAV